MYHDAMTYLFLGTFTHEIMHIEAPAAQQPRYNRWKVVDS